MQKKHEGCNEVKSNCLPQVM